MKSHISFLSRPRTPLILAASIAALLSSQSAHAASATWNATPTNGFWEAAGAEDNWSTGAGTFPGALNALTNADVATFLTSSMTTIAIDSSTTNASPLGIRGITIGVNASTPSAFTIGSAGANGGNALLLGSGGNITIVTGATGSTTQIINAPLVLQPTSAVATGSYQFVNSGGTNALQINGNVSGGTTSQGITLTLSGTSSSAGNVLSGVISNGTAANVSIIKANSGTWSLTGTNNSFNGGVRVDQGTLNAATVSTTGNNSSIGSGGGLVFVAGGSGNATLNINGAGGTTDRAITFNNNTGGSNHGIISSNGSGPVALTGNITPGTVGNTTAATFELGGANAGANAASGDIADNGARVTSIIKSGAGTWTLSGPSSAYTGTTTLSAGLLNIGSANALGTTGAFVISGNGSFDNTSAALVTLNKAFNLSGGSPTFIGTDNMTINGLTTISGAATRTITVTANTLTLAGGVAEDVAGRNFAKAGAGTLAVSGTSSYTGTTTVSGGTLLVNGTHTSAGAYSVSSTGTLGGSGSITTAGNVGVSISGKLSPGGGADNSLSADLGSGTFNISAAVTATNSQSMIFDLTTTAASDIVQLTNASSTLAIGTGVLNFDDFTFNAGAGFGAGTYTLFDTANTINGTLGSISSGTVGGLSATIEFANSSQDLVLTVVPEPATWSMLFGGLGMAIGLQRIRRRR